MDVHHIINDMEYAQLVVLENHLKSKNITGAVEMLIELEQDKPIIMIRLKVGW